MATATIPLKGSASMESKKVSISSKRQITIPQKFFTLLGFNTEAECIMRGNELVLRPVCICYRTGGYGNWRNRYLWNSSLSE